KELAVRAALGASRYRVSRQLLSESVLLSLLGSAVGVLLAVWSVDAINRLHPPGLPQFAHVNLDYPVLGFTFAIAVLTGIASGLAPTVFACRTGVSDTLKDAAQTQTETRGLRFVRKSLVVCEISLAAVLLAGSGLLIRSFLGLLRVDPGFNPHRVLTLRVGLPESKYPDPRHQSAFFESLLQRLTALPGVAHAGAISQLPLAPYTRTGAVVFEGRPAPPPGLRPGVPIGSVTDDYFRAMGIPLIAGRSFNSADTARSSGVVLVNEAFRRRFFPDEQLLGKRIQLGDSSAWLTIVGVTGDVRQLGVQTEPSPEMFTAFSQEPRSTMSLALQTAENPAALAAAVRKEVMALDREQPAFDIATMEQRLADSLAAQRWNMWLLTAFAGTALALAAAGIYGVISYFVVQRTHEIGVRMALGATPESILALILRQGAAMVVLGGIIGIAISLGLTRSIAGMIYGIRVTDPETYAGVGVLIAGVALIASYIPARRATKVDPMVALRYE
ncbi:MAG TPA: FtsX-like permease family protein, partial [Terriglobales bacterium]